MTTATASSAPYSDVDLKPTKLPPLFRAPLVVPAMQPHGDTVAPIYPVQTVVRRPRTPIIHAYSPRQTAALAMITDEVCINITDLNLGRETRLRYGHVGAVFKRDGRILAHLDGLPAEMVSHTDGTQNWVPVGMGKHNHFIKMFCLTPATMQRRTKMNGDITVYRDIGSLSLADLPYERRLAFAESLEQAMIAINDKANIPYIIPGSSVTDELLMMAGLRKAADAANAITGDVGEVVDMASHAMQHVISPFASLVTGHRIVPNTVAAAHGANSLDILLAIADRSGRRDEVVGFINEFLARPDMRDLRCPGGNSDVWGGTLWRFSPAWPEIEAQVIAERKERHRQAVANLGRLAAAGAAVVFFMQSGSTAVAMEAMRHVQSRIGDGQDPVGVFMHAVDRAASAVNDPVGTISSATEAAFNPWRALNETPVIQGLSVTAFASLTLALVLSKRGTPKLDDKSNLTANTPA